MSLSDEYGDETATRSDVNYAVEEAVKHAKAEVYDEMATLMRTAAIGSDMRRLADALEDAAKSVRGY